MEGLINMLLAMAICAFFTLWGYYMGSNSKKD